MLLDTLATMYAVRAGCCPGVTAQCFSRAAEPRATNFDFSEILPPAYILRKAFYDVWC